LTQLQGQGPRAEVARRVGCRNWCDVGRRDLQPTWRRDARVRPRRFSAGPKTGAASCSQELGVMYQDVVPW